MDELPPNSAQAFAELRKLLKAKTREYFEQPERSMALKAAMMATVFDTIADGLLIFDDKQTLILANAAAAEMAKWDAKDLMELSRADFRKYFKLYKSDAKTPLPIEDEAIMVAMRTKEPYETEGFVTGTTLPLEGKWLRAKAAPILNDKGDGIGGVTVFHDITERLKLERQRDCLTALIAHDLKNHLAANAVLLDLLQGLFGATLDDEVLTLMSELKKSNAWFFDVSNSLLELSRAEFFSTNAYGQEANLGSIVQSVVDLNMPAAASRGITLELSIADDLSIVRVIPAVIGQVFHNVIQNAVEASENESSIEIDVREDKESKRIAVKVTDHGSGMSPEEVALLFDAKQVAAHVPKTTHSTGFGLYLSAMLIEAQGGKILCTSEVGQGTEITVLLPTEPSI